MGMENVFRMVLLTGVSAIPDLLAGIAKQLILVFNRHAVGRGFVKEMKQVISVFAT